MSILQIVQIYIELWSALICILFCVTIFMIRKSEPHSSITLLRMFAMIVVLFLADALGLYFDGKTSEMAFYAVRTSSFFVYLFSLIVPTYTVAFLLETIGDHQQRIPRSWAFAMGTVAAIWSILLLISLFTGWYYSFDQSNTYIRGDYYFLSQIGPGIIFLIYLVCLLYYRKLLGTREFTAMATYCILPVIAAVIQFHFYGLSLINIAMAISAVIMFGQRMSSKSLAVRKARERIAEEYARERMSVKPGVEERLRKASLGKGNVKHIFIVNPFAGEPDKVEKLRHVIEKLPEQDYFIFTTSEPQCETELMHQISHYFEDYKLRVYCCGGTGTLRNVINGIEDFTKVSVGFYPCGLSNDFLNAFGKEKEKFEQIENLIDGDILAVDMIRTNHGSALNAVSIGMDANVLRLLDYYRGFRVFGMAVPYMISVLRSAFSIKQQEYRIDIDGKTYIGKHPEFIFGNGCMLAGLFRFGRNAQFTDGFGSVFLADKRNAFGTLRTARIMAQEDLEKVQQRALMTNAQNISISHVDKTPMAVCFDGEIEHGITQLDAHIVHRGLNFIVPKGVEIHG